jgi:hypothetical protein
MQHFKFLGGTEFVVHISHNAFFYLNTLWYKFMLRFIRTARALTLSETA